MHNALNCYHRFEKAFQSSLPPAANTTHTDSSTENMGYPDAGASNHITGDLNSLSDRLPYTGSDQVVMGNGSGLKIHSTENALLTPSVKLTNIRSQIVKNLLSISQLIKDNGCLVNFSHMGFV